MLATVYDGGPEGMAVHSVMVFQTARWFAAQCMVVFSIIDGQELPHKPKSTCPKVAVGTQSINRLKILPQDTILAQIFLFVKRSFSLGLGEL